VPWLLCLPSLACLCVSVHLTKCVGNRLDPTATAPQLLLFSVAYALWLFPFLQINPSFFPRNHKNKLTDK
jgi:hypothetical protein